MIWPEGCALLSPREVQVVAAALRYAVATANREAVRAGGLPAFVGPAGELLAGLAGVGHSGHQGSSGDAGSGDAVVYIGTTEVARMTGWPERTARRRCAAMRSRRRSPGGGWLVDEQEVRELAEGQVA